MRLQGSFAKLRMTVCGVLFCALVYGQDTPLNDAAAILNRARNAYRQRDYETAKGELQLAQAARKNWPEASMLGALIAWQENKRGDAIKYAKEAIRLQPVFPPAHYLLARLFFESSKLEEAHKEVSVAMEQGQQFADIYVLLGDIEIMRHKSKEALAAYETAIQQPAPKNELTNAFQLRREAVRNMVEFIEHKSDARYQRPVLVRESLRAATSIGGTGKVELAGILDSQGQYVDIVLLNADVGLKGKDELLTAARQIKFSPARKDGTPVPFWLYFSYARGVNVTRQ